MMDMNHFMRDIERLQRLVEEIENEKSRLWDKMVDEGLTEKEQTQFDLLDHLDAVMK